MRRLFVKVKECEKEIGFAGGGLGVVSGWFRWGFLAEFWENSEFFHSVYPRFCVLAWMEGKELGETKQR